MRLLPGRTKIREGKTKIKDSAIIYMYWLLSSLINKNQSRKNLI
jgi:hypothetical protein